MVSKRRSHALLCRAALLPCRFAGIARLAGKQLEPYVAQMVPKLYRLQVTMPVPFEQLCKWTGVTIAITVSCRSLFKVMWSRVVKLHGSPSDQTAQQWQLDIACVAIQRPADYAIE